VESQLVEQGLSERTLLTPSAVTPKDLIALGGCRSVRRRNGSIVGGDGH
jgi:hypothetical protein